MEDNRKILKGDKYIWGTYFFLCLISIISMYSASGMLTMKSGEIYDPIIRHAIFLIISTLIVFAVHYVHYKWLRLFGLPLFAIAAVLLLYTLFFAEKVNDAARWITIGGIPIQPSEIAKLGVVISVAYFLARGQSDKGVTTLAFRKSIIIVAIACILIFTENFSTAALIALVSYCMMLIAGVSLKKLHAIVLIVVMAVAAILFTAHILDKNNNGEQEKNLFMTAIHRANMWNDRLFNFAGDGTPEYLKETDDDNFQRHHAYMAIAHSNGIGVGPGNSRERDILPQAYSDFIYAIIIEEFGIAGGLFVMGLYLSLLFRAFQITRKCTQAFPAFLIMGIALLIVFQALLNMMVATGVAPVTGQPLPLISRGGTSVLINGIYFGIMLSISRYATTEAIEINKDEGKEEIEIPESISAPNPNLKK